MPQAVTTGGRNPPLALVLGLPGSGLGLCAQVLRLAGFDPIGADSAVAALDERILALFDRPFATPAYDLQLPPGWWADPRLQPLRQELLALLRQHLADGARLALVDPRIARLLPLWHQLLRPLPVHAKLVLCLRNPARLGRDMSEAQLAEQRWFVDVCEVFRHRHGGDLGVVQFERWFTDPDSNLRRLENLLGIDRGAAGDLRDAVAGLVAPARRHDSGAEVEARHPLVRAVYRLLCGFAEDGAGSERIDTIVDQFVAFRQLHRPFEQQFETSARPPAAPDESEALRQTVEEERRRVSEREQHLAQLRAELAARDARLAELAAQHDETAARRMAAAQREIEGLRSQLAQKRDELAARQAQLAAQPDESAALAAAQSEVEAVRAQLAQAEAAAQQAAAEHARQLAAAQAEAAGLRAGLAVRESEGGARTRASTAAEAEAASLRGWLAAAREEIALLRRELAAAENRAAAGD